MSLPDGTPICRITEAELLGVSNQCKWPMTAVTLYHSVGLPQIAAATEAQIFQKVCDNWNAVANLNLHVVSTPQGANIVSSSQRIDGPMGILGESELPCGASPSTQLTQVFDNSEAWDATMFYQTVLHEVGHAIGLEHAPMGTGAVMEPVLNRSITAPAAWDKQQIQARYGAPKSTTGPTPTGTSISVPEAGNYLITITIGQHTGHLVLPLDAGTQPVSLAANRR